LFLLSCQIELIIVMEIKVILLYNNRKKYTILRHTITQSVKTQNALQLLNNLLNCNIEIQYDIV